MAVRRIIALKERTTTPAAIPESMQKKKKIKGLEDIIAEAKKMSDKYKDKYICITDADELKQYIDKCIENKRVAIDTETTGLDIFNDQIVGFSLYTAGLKACYVPLKHLSRMTGQPDKRQLDYEFCAGQLDRLNGVEGLELDMFNAQFDLNMLWYSMHVKLWDIPNNDASLMAHMLDTERAKGTNGLKELHADWCDNTTRGPKFNELFPAGSFNVCPMEYAFTYAARDAEMTWELVDYCYEQMKLPGNEDLLKAWLTTEKPLIPVLLRMRERGIAVNLAYRAELTAKYQAIADEAEQAVVKEYEPFIPLINQWRIKYSKVKGKNIDLPVKLDSKEQLAILLWDIMKLPHDPDDTSTDKKALKATDTEIARAILRYREANKLLSTYLVGLDKYLQPDGCVHGEIRQRGAATGRTSANNPNMQNIPSHNREIRQMYVARPNCYLISCDYSAQEPRITACVAKDEEMIKAYREGKDLYSMIASVATGYSYYECLDKHDNVTYLPGKERRGTAKVLMLGLTYGMQMETIAKSLKCTTEEAQVIYDKVLKGFPGLRKAQENAAKEAHEKGYVSNLWGGRRYFKVMLHDDYEFHYKEGNNPEFDPYEPRISLSSGNAVNPVKSKEWCNKLSKMKRWKDKEQFIEELKSKGIEVEDYAYKKKKESTKLLNAAIQGSAAAMSKLAMIAIDRDERLKKINTYLLLMIHDEVICECPRQHLAEAVKYIKEDMTQCVTGMPVPFLADAENSDCWYGKEIVVDLEVDEDGDIIEE